MEGSMLCTCKMKNENVNLHPQISGLYIENFKYWLSSFVTFTSTLCKCAQTTLILCPQIKTWKLACSCLYFHARFSFYSRGTTYLITNPDGLISHCVQHTPGVA